MPYRRKIWATYADPWRGRPESGLQAACTWLPDLMAWRTWQLPRSAAVQRQSAFWRSAAGKHRLRRY